MEGDRDISPSIEAGTAPLRPGGCRRSGVVGDRPFWRLRDFRRIQAKLQSTNTAHSRARQRKPPQYLHDAFHPCFLAHANKAKAPHGLCFSKTAPRETERG